MTEHQVVVFDVTAPDILSAGRGVIGLINGTRGLYVQGADSPQIESWWMPEEPLRSEVDRNDNAPMHLEPDSPPHDIYVEDDAEDEPTIWLHDHCEPQSPLPLLRRVDVASVWPTMSQDRRDLTYAAGDVLWKHIVRGLPTSPPAVTS